MTEKKQLFDTEGNILDKSNANDNDNADDKPINKPDDNKPVPDDKPINKPDDDKPNPDDKPDEELGEEKEVKKKSSMLKSIGKGILKRITFDNFIVVFNIVLQIIVYIMILCMIAKLAIETLNVIYIIYIAIKDFLKLFFNPYGIYNDNSIYSISNLIKPANDISMNDICYIYKGVKCVLFSLKCFNLIILMIGLLIVVFIIFNVWQMLWKGSEGNTKGINDLNINKLFLFIAFIIFIFCYICYFIYYYLYKNNIYKSCLNLSSNVNLLDNKISEYIYNETLKPDEDLNKFYAMLVSTDTNKEVINNYFNNIIETNYEKDLNTTKSNILSKRLLFYDIFNYFNYISFKDDNFIKIENYLLKNDESITFFSILDSKNKKLINKYHQDLDLFINLENNENDSNVNNKSKYINNSINIVNNNIIEINDIIRNTDTTTIIYIFALIYMLIMFFLTWLFIYYLNTIFVNNADKFPSFVGNVATNINKVFEKIISAVGLNSLYNMIVNDKQTSSSIEKQNAEVFEQEDSKQSNINDEIKKQAKIKAREEQAERKAREEQAIIKAREEQAERKIKEKEANIKAKEKEADIKTKEEEADIKTKEEEADIKEADKEEADKEEAEKEEAEKIFKNIVKEGTNKGNRTKDEYITKKIEIDNSKDQVYQQPIGFPEKKIVTTTFKNNNN